ncbi:MAG: hypothetical protein ABFS41_18490 [Myxococcota bacterium]
MGAQHLVAAVASASLVLVLAAGVASVRSEPAVAPELATTMGHLQRHTHKLMLSIDAENAALAAFYLHEVHEIAEQLEALFPDHDGVPVAALAGELLEPRIAALDGALEAGDWELSRDGLAALVDGCNACHAATGHEFIRVELTTSNPFNQSFAD